jgi:6,7-dimethyl-8-ribityllumazine synthase
MNEYKGALHADGKRFALIASRFNEALVQQLVNGAVDCLNRLGADEGDVDLYWVPGAFEAPLAASRAAASGRYDAVIVLGVVIRGETLHFDLVAGEAARGIARVSAETGLPVVFGVLAAETWEQASDRAGGKKGNRGWEAAEAAVEMVNLGEAFTVENSAKPEGSGRGSRLAAQTQGTRGSRGEGSDATRSGNGRRPAARDPRRRRAHPKGAPSGSRR